MKKDYLTYLAFMLAALVIIFVAPGLVALNKPDVPPSVVLREDYYSLEISTDDGDTFIAIADGSIKLNAPLVIQGIPDPFEAYSLREIHIDCAVGGCACL